MGDVDRTPALPGADLIESGLKDLASSVESVPGLLVAIGAPRLRQLGIDVPETPRDPEHRLYALLASDDPDSAHSLYNALIRRLVSYERALACARPAQTSFAHDGTVHSVLDPTARPVASPILCVMPSVADELRTDGRRRLASMTPDERLALAFRLADDDLALRRSASSETAEETRARIRQSRQVGRVPSRAARP
jgi:hypothetical protein